LDLGVFIRRKDLLRIEVQKSDGNGQWRKKKKKKEKRKKKKKIKRNNKKEKVRDFLETESNSHIE